MDDCSYCHGVRLVGWSGAGPILCPTCSSGADAFTVITHAWREQRKRAIEAENERDRLRSLMESERALCRKMDAEFSAARVGIMALQGELHEHLSLLVQYLQEETAQGDGIADEHFAGYVAAKSLLVRSAPNQPSWENAQIEVADLARKASEVPGLSAELDRVRWERDRAVSLLHMLDRGDARHPDIASFLDGVKR